MIQIRFIHKDILYHKEMIFLKALYLEKILFTAYIPRVKI